MATRRRLLLLTANVGSLFDEDQKLQEFWLDVMSQRIILEKAELVVLHMQETGGKQYEEYSAQVPSLIFELCERLKLLYPCCKAFLDLNFSSPGYTALGSIVFIHKGCTDIAQYDFVRKVFSPVLVREDTELVDDGLENERRTRKHKFPKHFWPAIKWGRKGYLQMRWKLGTCILDFINVHLFHDESNLALIHENPQLYSLNRKRALDFVLSDCVVDEGIEQEISRFIFGDLNFRLDCKSFLNRITDRAEVHPLDELQHQGSQQGLTAGNLLSAADANQNGRHLSAAESLRRSVSAIEFRRENGGNTTKENCVLRIEKKRFDYFNHKKLLQEWQKYLEDDKEVKSFSELHELPISFPPTYPWSEDPSESNQLMKTRAPAWCDRVLMNANAFQSICIEASKYESLGHNVCMGDHKPVLLSLEVLA